MPSDKPGEDLTSFRSTGEDRRLRRTQPRPAPLVPKRSETDQNWEKAATFGHTTALSPPPTPKTMSPSLSRSSMRLRSNSGLTPHVYRTAFSQYTGCNADGTIDSTGYPSSLGSPIFTPDFFSSINAFSAGGAPGEESLGCFETPAPSAPPFVNLFQRDVVQMALHSPTLGPKIAKFAQSRNREGNVEFLHKIDEYDSALNTLKSIVSHISSSWIGVTATTPLGLHPDVNFAVNANLKQFAKTILPTMEKMFQEAKAAIEERLVKDVYPAFVKHQFAQCMISSLSTRKPSMGRGFNSAYPGLGTAFYLTDPMKIDNPIAFVSNGMLAMSGYTREEVLQKNWLFLHGLLTNEDAIGRIKEAMFLKREATELVLNYRKDGTPFWNLVFLYPLYEQERIRYCLSGQINVSEGVGAEGADMMRILSIGCAAEETASKGLSSPDRASKRQSPHPERHIDRTPSIKSREEVRRRPERRRFFKSFSKKSNASSLTATLTRTVSSRSNLEGVTQPKSGTSRKREPRIVSSLDTGLRSPYSRFLVLRYVPPAAQSPRQDRAEKKITNPLLQLSFCSPLALEILSIDSRDENLVLGKDIFEVLADQASSPSVTRALRSTIRERAAAGESVSVDLLVSAETPTRHYALTKGRKSGIISMAKSRNRAAEKEATALPPGLTCANFQEEARIPGPKSVAHTRAVSAVGREEGDGVGYVLSGPKTRKVVSHWTPLMDAEGDVAWVVLILLATSSG